MAPPPQVWYVCLRGHILDVSDVQEIDRPN